MMAATVVPAGDCSIAMMRACFERASALWVLGSSADCGFVAFTDDGDFVGDDFVSDGFLADFDIEILHSAHDGVTPHNRSPASANKPARQDLGAPLSPKSDDSSAPIAAECQSFRQTLTTNSATLDRRMLSGTVMAEERKTQTRISNRRHRRQRTGSRDQSTRLPPW